MLWIFLLLWIKGENFTPTQAKWKEIKRNERNGPFRLFQSFFFCSRENLFQDGHVNGNEVISPCLTSQEVARGLGRFSGEVRKERKASPCLDVTARNSLQHFNFIINLWLPPPKSQIEWITTEDKLPKLPHERFLVYSFEFQVKLPHLSGVTIIWLQLLPQLGKNEKWLFSESTAPVTFWLSCSTISTLILLRFTTFHSPDEIIVRIHTEFGYSLERNFGVE